MQIRNGLLLPRQQVDLLSIRILHKPNQKPMEIGGEKKENETTQTTENKIHADGDIKIRKWHGLELTTNLLQHKSKTTPP
jgi:hypothetical protein